MLDIPQLDTEQDKLNAIMKALEKKCLNTGQSVLSYLEGSLETKYPNYWDYIQLDILLNLQHPKTTQPDEAIFIIYHQITELIFRLIIHETEQLLANEMRDLDSCNKKVRRLNDYYQYLICTFPILVNGMDRDSFQVFRKPLYPASGQQSVQFRIIEILATDLGNLVHHHLRPSVRENDTAESLYPKLYWQGIGHKSATLKQFDEKYYEPLISRCHKHRDNNLSFYINRRLDDIVRHDIFQSLRALDLNANVKWAMEHYNCVSLNLGKGPRDASSTGSTDWRKYLHPQYRKIIFFPSLWSEEEKENWGIQ